MSPVNPANLNRAVERIHDRLVRGENPGDETVRQEAARAGVPVAAVEAIMRLDDRFARGDGGWSIRPPTDDWPDLAAALAQALTSPSSGEPSVEELLPQVVRRLDSQTKAHFADHYPADFTLTEATRSRIGACLAARLPNDLAAAKGPVFDLVMSELFDNSDLNRFFTPRSITRMVAAWAQLQPGQRALDPCCGSGGFLLAAGSYPGVHLTGLDLDRTSVWTSHVNLELHGLASEVILTDALDLAALPVPEGSQDLVAGNPPFGGKVSDPEILGRFELGRDAKGRLRRQHSTEALFLELFIRLATPGGRIAILLPDGILANTGEQSARDYVLGQTHLEAIISLPPGAFASAAKSNIVLMRRREPGDQAAQQRPVFLAAVQGLSDLDEALATLRQGAL